MAALTIKTNPLRGTPVQIDDLGIEIPASGGSEVVTDSDLLGEAQISVDLRDLSADNAFGVGSSTLILNDGTIDVDQDEIENFLAVVQFVRTGPYSVPIRDGVGGETVSTARAPCRVATTGNILTLAGGAPGSPDGVPLAPSDRILVKDQSFSSQNGIYVVTVVGGGVNGTWVRALDADESVELVPASVVTVSEGAIHSNTSWMLTTTGPIIVNTTALVFTRTGGGEGSDTTAIHDNVAGEITAVPEKAVPGDGDWLLLEDSASGSSKKRVQIGNLPGKVYNDSMFLSAQTTTSSTSFVDAFSGVALVVPVTGAYFALFECEASGSNSNTSLEVALGLNSTTAPLAESPRVFDSPSSNDKVGIQTTLTFTATIGDTVHGLFRKAGGSTAKLDRRRLTILRASI